MRIKRGVVHTHRLDPFVHGHAQRLSLQLNMGLDASDKLSIGLAAAHILLGWPSPIAHEKSMGQFPPYLARMFFPPIRLGLFNKPSMGHAEVVSIAGDEGIK